METGLKIQKYMNIMKVRPEFTLSKILSFKPIFRYEQLPSYEKGDGSNSTSPVTTTIFGRRIELPCSSPGSHCSRLLRRPCTRQQRLLGYLIAVTGVITLVCLIGLGINGIRWGEVDYYWQKFPRYVKFAASPYHDTLGKLTHIPYRSYGLYNGIKMLVPPSEFTSEQQYNLVNSSVLDQYNHNDSSSKSVPSAPTFDPIIFNPYPDYASSEYLHEHAPVKNCYLDKQEKLPAPDVYAYPGIPQGAPNPSVGSHSELGLDSGVCFERYGRFASYGHGYDINEGGDAGGLKENSEHSGTEKIWEKILEKYGKRIDWRDIDLGAAQNQCYEKNKARFNTSTTSSSSDSKDDASISQIPRKKRVRRTAFILRSWIGYEYTRFEILTMRALVNELNLKSGGEYDVHLLVHVKDKKLPIWSDPEVYQQTIEENIPRELWGLVTLWSEAQMSLYYPGPFPYNVENDSKRGTYNVYRSAHFALQWFANDKHPEYDYYWNWEMDVRLTGHYYEFFEGLRNWAKIQPRKGIWERSSRFWIPEVHGDYSGAFRRMVENETAEAEKNNGRERPVWGPADFKLRNASFEHPEDTTPPWSYEEDNYEWGVGEDADLITVNPIFDPSKTDWVFRKDVTGYDLDVTDQDDGNDNNNNSNNFNILNIFNIKKNFEKKHLPPRRAAIITTSLLSRRLLGLMHHGTARHQQTMFPEMIAPSVALHHGLKAVYAPHPVYFSRDWPPARLDKVMNRAEHRHDSVFGGAEHTHMGSSYYYNSRIAGAIWLRFFGGRDGSEGGMYEEKEERKVPGERGQGTGRMCLRSMLLHPVKKDI